MAKAFAGSQISHPYRGINTSQDTTLAFESRHTAKALKYSGKLLLTLAPSPRAAQEGQGFPEGKKGAPAGSRDYPWVLKVSASRKPQPKNGVSLIGKRETSVSVGDSALAKSRRLKQEGRKCYVGRELKSLL